MKNAFLKKALCILSAAVLVLSFAACGNNADEGDTTEPTVLEEATLEFNEDLNNSENDSQADTSDNVSESDTQSADSEKTEETKEQSQGSSTASKPDSKADIIAAYNSAVTKSGLSRTAMSQTITKGNVNAAGIINYDVTASEHASVRNQINVNNTSKAASDLKTLSSSNVSNATRSGNTVTITLNTFTGSSVSNGAGGYVGVVDDARRDQIIDIIAGDIGVNGVKLASGSYTLQNGVIKATFNDDFTKITKVTFTASENYAGKLKYLVMSIDANVAVNLSSTYSA